MEWQNRIAERVKTVPPSGIRRFASMAGSVPGAISLTIGEPDFSAPLKVRESCIESLRAGETSYTTNAGLIELREELARYLKNHYDLQYDPATEIIMTAGSGEALEFSMLAFLNPGDEILIPDPAYVAYPACAHIAGAVPVFVPTSADNGFALSADLLERYVTPRTRALIVASPNNPTGTTLSREALQEIADFAIRHDLIVISDEIYSYLTYDEDYISIASLPHMKERTLRVSGFSKSYAMTGLRIGYINAPAEAVKVMLKIHQYTILCAPVTSQYGAITALRECDADADAMKAEYHRRRDVLYKGLREAGFDVVRPTGAFYMFPCIRSTGLTSEEFALKLFEREKVAVVPGSCFGPSGEGYVRLSYAASMEDIEEAVRRFRHFMEIL